MPMDEDAVLHFEAVVLDDETRAWSAKRVASVVAALQKAGVSPTDASDPDGWAESAGTDGPITFAGDAGTYELLLEESGGWWWDTPYATLMKGRHNNKPEAVDEVVSAVRATVGAAPPYYGCTWFSSQVSPLWLRTSDPFQAQDGKAIQYFSARYLEANCGGKPYSDPPVRSEEVGGGQLLVADPRAFGEATVVALEALTDYLQTYARRNRRGSSPEAS